MGFSKFMLNAGEKLRPVITKIIPMKLLSAIKAKIINNAAEGLDADSYEPYQANANPRGINIIGNIKGDNGLGQSARIMVELVKRTKEPFIVKDYYVPPGGLRTNNTYDAILSDKVKYDINIIHLNASEMMVGFLSLGKDIWNKRYNIGYWAWELETFPEEWMTSFKLVDEVWTPSDFVTNTLKKYTDKPVITVPHSVEAKTDSKYDRKYFNLPEDKFLFLVMFNSGSVMERKNPIAAIKAFKEAFARDEEARSRYRDAVLVIKIAEAELSENDKDIIESVIKPGDNIHIMCGHLSKIEVHSLLKAVDVYVSLHRSEGFGLVMAEAMYVGTPVIATNWSGNTEFMNQDVACMVDYSMIELDRDIEPFKKGDIWADASVTDAARFMRRLFDDKEYYSRIANNCEKHAKQYLSYERSAKIVADRVKEIRKV